METVFHSYFIIMKTFGLVADEEINAMCLRRVKYVAKFSRLIGEIGYNV